MRENVSVSAFTGNIFKRLLSETPTGDQLVLTVCDNLPKLR